MIVDRVKDYIILGLSIVVLVLGMSLTVQSARLKVAKAELKVFVAEVKSAGTIAQAAADQRKKDEARKTKESNNATSKELTDLRADNDRLRKQRASAGSSVLPPTARSTGGGKGACFDGAELDAAISRDLERAATRLESLIQQGDEARVKLDGVKRDAQQ